MNRRGDLRDNSCRDSLLSLAWALETDDFLQMYVGFFHLCSMGIERRPCQGLLIGRRNFNSTGRRDISVVSGLRPRR